MLKRLTLMVLLALLTACAPAAPENRPTGTPENRSSATPGYQYQSCPAGTALSCGTSAQAQGQAPCGTILCKKFLFAVRRATLAGFIHSLPQGDWNARIHPRTLPHQSC